jgi:hypothetical protein
MSSRELVLQNDALHESPLVPGELWPIILYLLVTSSRPGKREASNVQVNETFAVNLAKLGEETGQPPLAGSRAATNARWRGCRWGRGSGGATETD